MSTCYVFTGNVRVYQTFIKVYFRLNLHERTARRLSMLESQDFLRKKLCCKSIHIKQRQKTVRVLFIFYHTQLTVCADYQGPASTGN